MGFCSECRAFGRRVRRSYLICKDSVGCGGRGKSETGIQVRGRVVQEREKHGFGWDASSEDREKQTIGMFHGQTE